MAWLRWMALGGALTACAGACGYPTFMFTGTGGAGGASGTGSTSSTAIGSGSGKASSVVSSSTSASSSSGFPAMCRLLHDSEDCGAGKRCTIHSEDTGTTHCVTLAASPDAPFDSCNSDTPCPAGAWCDWRTNTCAPFCTSSSDCGIGNCVSARNSKQKTIPGASVCTAHCDPVSLVSCGTGATCEYDPMATDFDCFKWGGKHGGDACTYLADCEPGYVCGSSSCLAWCHPAGSNSSICGGTKCAQFSNLTPVYNSAIYGYCQ